MQPKIECGVVAGLEYIMQNSTYEVVESVKISTLKCSSKYYYSFNSFVCELIPTIILFTFGFFEMYGNIQNDKIDLQILATYMFMQRLTDFNLIVRLVVLFFL